VTNRSLGNDHASLQIHDAHRVATSASDESTPPPHVNRDAFRLEPGRDLSDQPVRHQSLPTR
jgi:hypothetical protein